MWSVDYLNFCSLGIIFSLNEITWCPNVGDKKKGTHEQKNTKEELTGLVRLPHSAPVTQFSVPAVAETGMSNLTEMICNSYCVMKKPD